MSFFVLVFANSGTPRRKAPPSVLLVQQPGLRQLLDLPPSARALQGHDAHLHETDEEGTSTENVQRFSWSRAVPRAHGSALIPLARTQNMATHNGKDNLEMESRLVLRRRRKRFHDSCH